MPLAFLGALLLLLFLLPQGREAVGRRPKAGGQINMNPTFSSTLLELFISRKVDKRCPTIHLTAESSHSGELTFSSSSSARIFSSSSSPWAEGTDRHQRRGCKQRQSRERHLRIRSADMKCEFAAGRKTAGPGAVFCVSKSLWILFQRLQYA